MNLGEKGSKRRRIEFQCPKLSELCCQCVSKKVEFVQSFSGISAESVERIFELAFWTSPPNQKRTFFSQGETCGELASKLKPFLSDTCCMKSLDLSFLCPDEREFCKILQSLSRRSFDATPLEWLRLPPKITEAHAIDFSTAPGDLMVHGLDLRRCCNVSRKVLEALCARWNLKGLRLAQTYLEAGSLSSLVLSGCLTNLVELDLSDCCTAAVDSKAISLMVKSCTKLLHLDLCGCWRVDDGAVIDISMNLKHLRFLDLGNIVSLSNFSVARLANLKDLCTLSLFRALCHNFWGTKITDIAIKRIIRDCRLLSHLNVYGIKLSQGFFDDLLNNCSSKILIVHQSFPLSSGLSEKDAKMSAKCSFFMNKLLHSDNKF
mmetsp:Transcript_34281/g.45320  ORF Transcript_34281/g.45320 Transcript_34281/m.45320 type:complete len:376 (+) Transcript_34281:30-1157(+)